MIDYLLSYDNRSFTVLDQDFDILVCLFLVPLCAQ